MKKTIFAQVHNNFYKNNNTVNWEQWCNFCKKWFSEEERFVRVDLEVTCMRGDDEVYCFHKKCFLDWIKELEVKYGKSIPVSPLKPDIAIPITTQKWPIYRIVEEEIEALKNADEYQQCADCAKAQLESLLPKIQELEQWYLDEIKDLVENQDLVT